MWDHLTTPTGLAPLLDPLLAWAIEATAVAAALAAVAALLGRSRPLASRPATRHLLWLLVLGKLATPPLLAWPWPVPRPGLARIAPRAVVEPPILASRSRISPPAPAAAGAPAAPPNAVASSDPAPARVGSVAVAVVRPVRRGGKSFASPGWRAWVALAWAGGGLLLAARHARQVFRFRRRLADAGPAPGWLLAEVGAVAGRLGVAAPPVRVVGPLASPVLWCLGRPTLLVPGRMLATLARDGWPAILAHELAHLRRGDPWVRRLELVAGLVWWWNPLYWLARRRLDFEAELACDAWAIWAAPRGRIAYAESLIRICAGLSPAGPPAPALGVAGTGRAFERRLTMILRNRSHHHLATPHRLAAALLAALALPSWTWADPGTATPAPAAARPGSDVGTPIGRAASPEVVADDPDPDPNPAFDPDPDFAIDPGDADDERDEARKKEAPRADPDDDDDEERDEARKKEAPRAEGDEKARAARRRADEKSKADQAKADAKRQAGLAKLQKRMEAMGKEMEAKFGPGSDFVKNIEKQFGEDSEFARNIEKQFGPDSDFAKNIEKQFGDGSDFARMIAGTADADPKPVKARPDDDARDASRDGGDVKAARDPKSKPKRAVAARVENPARGRSAADRRASRIDALEARINGLMAELERLKAESDDEDDDDDRR